MSSGDLAALSKISIDRIKTILAGNYVRITINEMDRIAAVLGIPLHNLLVPAELVQADVISDGERSDGSVAGSAIRRR